MHRKLKIKDQLACSQLITMRRLLVYFYDVALKAFRKSSAHDTTLKNEAILSSQLQDARVQTSVTSCNMLWRTNVCPRNRTSSQKRAAYPRFSIPITCPLVFAEIKKSCSSVTCVRSYVHCMTNPKSLTANKGQLQVVFNAG